MLREMKEMVRSIPFLDNPWLGFLHHTGRTHTMVTLSGYQFVMGSLPQFQTQVGGHMHQNPPCYVGRIWRASWARNFSSIPDACWCTNLDTFGGFHSYTPAGGFGRGANQPNFQGHFLHPMSRLSKIEFQAIEWNLAYLKSRYHLPYPTWDKYMYALMDSFVAEFKVHMSKLKMVKRLDLSRIIKMSLIRSRLG
ncbi:hypothetical protein KY284_032909 [Solanum tuberosum]|nr:hypothetical protein KY284_032909 [Solanum tuberosum]